MVNEVKGDGDGLEKKAGFLSRLRKNRDKPEPPPPTVSSPESSREENKTAEVSVEGGSASDVEVSDQSSEPSRFERLRSAFSGHRQAASQIPPQQKQPTPPEASPVPREKVAVGMPGSAPLADEAIPIFAPNDLGGSAMVERQSVAEPSHEWSPAVEGPAKNTDSIALGDAQQLPVEQTLLSPEPPEPPQQPFIATDNQAPAGIEKEDDKRFVKIRRALQRTGKGFGRVFLGKKQIDDELLEALETQLLTSDVGVEVALEVIEELTDRVKRKELGDIRTLQNALKIFLLEILKPCEVPLQISDAKPFVILTIGVNGAGKTTTIGKLAKRYLGEGRSVMLAAGDTFRAAAVEQLQVWGERNDVPVVAQHTGADSASVIFDALESAKARGLDVLVADTAGRLHTKSNLMEELKKIKRVVGKLDPSAPHEVLLVLDAGTGQNALAQLGQFHAAVGVTGIVLTKLDGTAKGGVIFALCRRFGIPIRYIGVGEGLEDLQPFCAEDFVEALLSVDE